MNFNSLIGLRLAVVLLLLWCSLSVNGQDWKALNMQFKKRYKENKMDSAVMIAEKILKQAETEFGKKDSNYVYSVEMLGTVYMETNNFNAAEKLYSESLIVFKEAFGERSEAYLKTLSWMAIIYNRANNFDKAEKIYKTTIKTMKEEKMTKKPIYLETITRYANFTQVMGRYKESEEFFKEAISLYKGVKKKKDIEVYAGVLNGLASLYMNQGYYNKSEPMYLEAIKTIDDAWGKKNRYYYSFLSNLSNLYIKIGNYNKAEQLQKEALSILKEVEGEKNPNYILFLNNLGSLYINIEVYDKAEECMTEALRAAKELNGEKHQNYARTLSGLGGLYIKKKNYVKAVENLKAASEIFKSIFGEKHTLYASSVMALATAYLKSGDNENALAKSEESLNIYKEMFGDNNLKTVEKEVDAAIINYGIGNMDKTEQYFLHANDYYLKELATSFTFLSENEQWEYLKVILNKFSFINSFISSRLLEKPFLSSIPYNNELAIKGALLQARQQMKDKILNCGDTALVNLYLKLKVKREKLSKLYSTPINKRSEKSDIIEEQLNKLEKELYLKSSYFKNLKDFGNVKWEDVSRNLKADETAIEFVKFNYYNRKADKLDSILYCALLLKNEYKHPKMIALFEEKQLGVLLQNKDMTEKDYINKLYSGKKGKQGLYDLIWKSIEKELIDTKTVYLSPTGLLNKISFNPH